MKRLDAYLKDGKLKLDFSGYKGKECEVELRRFRALGAAIGMLFGLEYDETKLRPETEAEPERELEHE